MAAHETWTPSRRLQTAATAERERIEREITRLSAREITLARELETIRVRQVSLREELEAIARFAAEEEGPSRRAPLRVVSGEKAPAQLRGAAIREAAVRTLVATADPAAPIHYRTWFELLVGRGLVPGGKDPLASFLTQIRRSPLVRSTTSAGTYVLDLEFPRLARERLAALRRDLAQVDKHPPGPEISSIDARRRRRAQLADEIGALERQLAEAARSLGELDVPGSRAPDPSLRSRS